MWRVYIENNKPSAKSFGQILLNAKHVYEYSKPSLIQIHKAKASPKNKNKNT
jgi:hypothetical protein